MSNSGLLAPPRWELYLYDNIAQSESDPISMLGISSSSSSSSSCTALVAPSTVPKCDPSDAVTTLLIEDGVTPSACGGHNVSFEYKRPMLGICAGEETLDTCEGTGAGLRSGGALACGYNGGCGVGISGSSTSDDVLGFG